MKVAFLGLGTMGGAMAMNIIKTGHDLIVYNRSKEKEEPLAKEGAARAASPQEAAAAAEVVIICVSDTPDVESLVLGPEGVSAGAKPGSVVVDMSTISPKATRRMAQELAQKGVKMVDAPVSGGSEGAEKATLTIMVGGETEDVDKVRPVLEAMGSNITHVGPIGCGQLTKAVNQIIVGGNYLAVAEGVAFGLKAGLDMDKVIAAIRGGAAASWVLDFRSGNMINNSYPLGFRARLHRKDIGIALAECREMGVSLPLSALVEQIENGLIGRGHGDEDISALARTLREEAGID
jgi:3-hydroxyisobutyrate dehydrogenase